MAPLPEESIDGGQGPAGSLTSFFVAFQFRAWYESGRCSVHSGK